jgi:hypothetical protein
VLEALHDHGVDFVSIHGPLAFRLRSIPHIEDTTDGQAPLRDRAKCVPIHRVATNQRLRADLQQSSLIF